MYTSVDTLFFQRFRSQHNTFAWLENDTKLNFGKNCFQDMQLNSYIMPIALDGYIFHDAFQNIVCTGKGFGQSFGQLYNQTHSANKPQTKLYAIG